MKTMKPNLHLNLSRQGSVKDVTTASGYMTPVHANMSTSSANYQYQTPAFNFSNRSDSISSFHSDYNGNYGPDSMMGVECTNVNSITSSIFTPDYESTPTAYTDNYDFTQRFDDALLNIYQNHLNKPNITPFNVEYPPSGIVSKISKKMYQKLLNDRSIQIDRNARVNDDLMNEQKQAYCLTLIRRRLLELCNSKADSITAPNSRSNSLNSGSHPLFAAPQPQLNYPKPSWLHQNPMYSATRLASSDSLVDTVQFSALGHNNNNQALQHSTPPHPSHPVPYFPYEMITPPTTANSSHQQPLPSPALSEAAPLHFYNGKLIPKPLQPTSSSDLFSFENPASAGVTHSPKPSLESPFHQTQFQFAPSPATPTPSSQSTLVLPHHHYAHPSNVKQNRFYSNQRSGSASSLGSISGAMSNSTGGAGNQPGEFEIDPLYNVTSQRKRDSLKLKRNMK